MKALLALLLATQALSAQSSPKTDSLNAAGFRYLDAYTQSHDLADARNAHRAFSEVLKKSPKDSHAHLGLGLAYTAVERQQLDPLDFNDATKPVNNTMAVRHLVAALEGDVDAVTAARALVIVARREYDQARTIDAINGLEKAATKNDAVAAALAELYLRLYENERAERAVAKASSVAARRQLAIAQLLQPGKVERGAQAYMQALTDADSAALEDFARDARWLADPDESSSWKRLSNAELKEKLRIFWQRRATTAGVPLPQRLATHFTRVQHAMQEFSYYRQRIGTLAALTINMHMDGLDLDVDDRAFTYVRYGEPDERIVTNDGLSGQEQSAQVSGRSCRRTRDGPSNCQNDRAKGTTAFPFNQTWVYRHIGQRPLAFDFFLLPGDPHGWTLVADVVRCAGGSLPYSEQYLRDRLSVDPRYGLLLAECGKGVVDAGRVGAIAMPFVRERTDSLNKAVIKDNGTPRTKKNISMLTDVVQFDDADGKTDVTAIVTWPLNSLRNVNGVVSVKLSFDVTDTIKGEIATRDTTVSVRIPPNAENPIGRMYLRMKLPPGSDRYYHIAARDMNDDSVVTITGDPLTVHSFGGTDLRISDIALVSAPTGTWARAGRTLSLYPRGVSSKNFAAYYEIYGIAPDAKYKSTISFEPRDEGLAAIVKKLKGKQVVSFTFDAENTTGENVIRELRALQAELPGGDYRLTVKIDANGKSASATRMIRLPAEANR